MIRHLKKRQKPDAAAKIPKMNTVTKPATRIHRLSSSKPQQLRVVTRVMSTRIIRKSVVANHAENLRLNRLKIQRLSVLHRTPRLIAVLITKLIVKLIAKPVTNLTASLKRRAVIQSVRMLPLKQQQLLPRNAAAVAHVRTQQASLRLR